MSYPDDSYSFAMRASSGRPGRLPYNAPATAVLVGRGAGLGPVELLLRTRRNQGQRNHEPGRPRSFRGDVLGEPVSSSASHGASTYPVRTTTHGHEHQHYLLGVR